MVATCEGNENTQKLAVIWECINIYTDILLHFCQYLYTITAINNVYIPIKMQHLTYKLKPLFKVDVAHTRALRLEQRKNKIKV